MVVLDSREVGFAWSSKDWAIGLLSGTGADAVLAIETDIRGNLYVAGTFQDVIDLDPSTGSAIHVAEGGRDLFIVKLSRSGGYVWAGTIGGVGNDESIRLGLDGAGGVFIAGEFSGVVDLDPGSGVRNVSSAGLEDVFILKLSASGGFLWGKTFSGVGSESITGIAVDSFDNVLVTGRLSGSVDFDPGDGVANLDSSGGYVAKLTSDGVFVWVRAYEGRVLVPLAIAVDASGDVYTTGNFALSADFDPGPGYEPLSAVALSAPDVFLAKLTSSGNYDWAYSFGARGGDGGSAISVDRAGSLYVGGTFNGTVDFDPSRGYSALTSGRTNGNGDVFILKMSRGGTFERVWAITGRSSIGSQQVFSLVGNQDEGLYVAGHFAGSVDFGSGSTTTARGGQDGYVARFDPSGSFGWVRTFGGSGNDQAQAVAFDEGGAAVVGASFVGEITIVHTTTATQLTSVGADDALILKLEASGDISPAVPSTTTSIPSASVPSSSGSSPSTTTSIPSASVPSSSGSSPSSSANSSSSVPKPLTPSSSNPSRLVTSSVATTVQRSELAPQRSLLLRRNRTVSSFSVAMLVHPGVAGGAKFALRISLNRSGACRLVESGVKAIRRGTCSVVVTATFPSGKRVRKAVDVTVK